MSQALVYELGTQPELKQTISALVGLTAWGGEDKNQLKQLVIIYLAVETGNGENQSQGAEALGGLGGETLS